MWERYKSANYYPQFSLNFEGTWRDVQEALTITRNVTFFDRIKHNEKYKSYLIDPNLELELDDDRFISINYNWSAIRQSDTLYKEYKG